MDLLKEIQTQLAGLAGELTALRRQFHQYPELSHQEERTAGVVAQYLQDLGLNVQTGIAGHGVVGTLRGSRPGRVVAYRADMDALPLTEKVKTSWRSRVPGVMHACGHDFHLSIALVTARLLSNLKDRLAGEFRFIFQPAEEGPPRGEVSGARGMVAAGVLDNPPVAAILGLHVAPNLDVGHIRYGPEVVMAGADRVILTITGKAAHGATPHRGVDPILVSAQVLTQIQGFLAQKIDARHPVVLTFGSISGGTRFNILAEKVTLEGSFRYLEDAVRQEVLAGLKKQLAGWSQATGAKIELSAQPIYPILKNDPQLSQQAVAALRSLLGAKRLKLHQPAMGSEDFSYFAAQAPAFYFFLGVRTPGAQGQALHSPEFAPDEAALPWGLRAAAGLLAALSEPEFILPQMVGGASPTRG
ncbi:MAG: M20 family metallopeptidase [Desulfobaccales bacterium]|nr:M20 family metallopeptidase [Desulfobaccales bacterium]